MVGLMDSRGPDRWQAAQPQSLLWVCIHPEVPNSQPGSHSLTLVRITWSRCGFKPSSLCPQRDTAMFSPLVCHSYRVSSILAHVDSCKSFTLCATTGLKSTRQTRQLYVQRYCSTELFLQISASLQASWYRANSKVLLLFHWNWDEKESAVSTVLNWDGINERKDVHMI